MIIKKKENQETNFVKKLALLHTVYRRGSGRICCPSLYQLMSGCGLPLATQCNRAGSFSNTVRFLGLIIIAGFSET